MKAGVLVPVVLFPRISGALGSKFRVEGVHMPAFRLSSQVICFFYKEHRLLALIVIPLRRSRIGSKCALRYKE